MSSRQNLDPKIWGPHAWKFVESVFHSFPTAPASEWTEEDRRCVEQIGNFFQCLSFILPCENCRQDYQKFLIAYPIEDSLDSPKSLWLWIFSMRKQINSNLAKLTHLTPEVTLQQSKAFFNLPFLPVVSLPNHVVHAPTSTTTHSTPHILSATPSARVINPLPSSSFSIPPHHPHVVSHPRAHFPPSTPTRGRGTLGSRMGLPNVKFVPVKGCNCGKR
uniref:thiol oxidase n=1 Tax=viral metagenome TaxID=1070528 RepID=A0A6C0CYR7_9ZZZZ